MAMSASKRFPTAPFPPITRVDIGIPFCGVSQVRGKDVGRVPALIGRRVRCQGL
jgi:hypothetical protein